MINAHKNQKGLPASATPARMTRVSVSGGSKALQAGVSLIITFFTAFYVFFIRRVRAMDNGTRFKILFNSAELQRAESSGSKPEKGVSLIITFFIMIIILTVVLSISVLLYSEIKLIRNLGNSVISLYAADSGIEKVLYYDRQVLGVEEGDSSCESDADCSSGYFCNNLTCATRRGLCSMIDSINNPKYCKAQGDGEPFADESIFCNPAPGDPYPLIPQGTDCGPACTDCTINFYTDIGGAMYTVEAKVDTAGNVYSDIKSSGAFGEAGRKIEITSLLDEQ